jgi:hypothetical protein
MVLAAGYASARAAEMEDVLETYEQPYDPQ